MAHRCVHNVKCADCDGEYDALTCFRVVPPTDRPEGNGQVYFICTDCWDRMVGAATMSMMRGL